MSKSFGNTIDLSDPPDMIEQKILPMITDPARKTRKDPGNPDICPVFDYHKVFSSQETQAWAAEGCRTAGIGCIDCKRGLLKHLLPVLEPIAAKRKDFEAHPDVIRDILREGNQKAATVAEQTMTEARHAVKI